MGDGSGASDYRGTWRAPGDPARSVGRAGGTGGLRRAVRRGLSTGSKVLRIARTVERLWRR